MKDSSQVKTLDRLKADYCGLIFYEGSKRWVGKPNEIFRGDLDKTAIKKIGVFVNEDPRQVVKIAADYHLYAVQLHGNESPDYCRDVRKTIKVIKVFRLEEGNDADELVLPFMDVADYFLFDNGKGGYGGSGEKFNWDDLRKAKINKPFFLSGGIGPADVALVKSFEHPFLFAIDINSRFEISPGVKDMDKLEVFINAVKEEIVNNGTTK